MIDRTEPNNVNEAWWPIGQPWPRDMSPGAVVSVELCAAELEILIEAQNRIAHANFEAGKGRVSVYHILRWSYLRQQLARIAPDRLSTVVGNA